MKVFNPPNAERKWKSVADKMKHREEEVKRIVELKKHALIDNGFKLHSLHTLVSVGYAMALEDNGLADW
ncbi:hypothetical protein I2I11_04070 [Pontibacter sp. 172403-2]|uniref:hypothetical protein n=1 Tax=Pontibacter rufus TaxID=2791028 RepID=UPI0018AFC5A5|nr:hypothetical protein [Pontibacter sp. 172403-2]MBF9252460.1 hypothetical protein [Pontibacter sp. 172403-2]